MSDTLLTGLNLSQREAVLHKDGPMLVLAGPGSGKTRVVTHRVAHLLRTGVRPNQIVALTFTNKAAEEMKSRLEVLTPSARLWMGTFHKFCAYLLRHHAEKIGFGTSFTIYDTDASLALIKQIFGSLPKKYQATPQSIQQSISWAKNNMVSAATYKDTASSSMLAAAVGEVYPLYQAELQRANAFDFDDLLLQVATLLKEHENIRAHLDNRFRYLLVDEYQDTNLVQYALARALCRDYPNLAVTGDPDQSIYGWRGANIGNILNFEHDYPNVKIVRLEQNYRSTKRILAAASMLIEHNTRRKHKKLLTDNPVGEKIRLVFAEDHKEEAETIAEEIAREIQDGKRKAKDFAVFYRTNALSRNVELALRRNRVPFQLVRGLEFYARKEVKDVIAYLQLVYNPQDTVAFHRVVNEPRRGIGKATLQKIDDVAVRLGISTLEAASILVAPQKQQKQPFVAGSDTKLPPKAVKSLAEFIQTIRRLQQCVAEDFPVKLLIEEVLGATNYLAQYEGSDQEDDVQRLANVKELLSAADEFDQMPHENVTNLLGDFLEQATLAGDVDVWESDTDKVSLMSLHAAKGLEFPVVYIIAVEDGILPHERSTHQPEQYEEERRLFFVGITRAEEELRLSYAQQRQVFGRTTFAISSGFLFELPQNDFWSVNAPGNIRRCLSAGEDGGFVLDTSYSQVSPDEGVDIEPLDPWDDGLSTQDTSDIHDGESEFCPDVEYEDDEMSVVSEETASDIRKQKANGVHKTAAASKLSLMTGADLAKHRK